MPATTYYPTAEEQLQLELINLFRMDPEGEFDRLIDNIASGEGVQDNITAALEYFGVDCIDLMLQLDAATAVAPVAWNNALALAAADHTALMLQHDEQSHQLPGEASLGQRIAAAGYNFSLLGENVYAYAYDGLYAHAGFVIDWGYDSEDFFNGTLQSGWKYLGDGIQDPAGHRITMLNGNMTEVGIEVLTDTSGQNSVGPLLVTQDFGTRPNYQAQLLGVVIADADNDSFYDLNEGLGGVTVTATGTAGTFTTTSWTSGGYQMELPPGSYVVSFSGGSLVGAARYSINMGNYNVKLDGFSRDAVTDAWLEGAGTAPGNPANDQLTGFAGNDRLFGDGFIPVIETDIAASVYRLYLATLDRVPDTVGYTGWTEQLVQGSSGLVQVAAGFVGSPEFQATYGDLNDTGFLQLLYMNVLGREADAAGLAGWTAVLADGASRADVVIGFSESQEFRNNTMADANTFAQGNNAASWSDDIYRLYQATLNRAPDEAGFLGWMDSLKNGASYQTAAAGFVNSPEFQNTYGELDDTAFLTLLYQNVLRRAADANGLAGWLEILNSGAGRVAVVEGFAQSPEFSTDMASDVKTWIRNLGVDDLLDGGHGQNFLWGGVLADQFVFDRTDQGHQTVGDFEAWDFLALQDFGYENGAAAISHMTQTGSDVIFTDQGTTVVLQDILLNQISTDNILL